MYFYAAGILPSFRTQGLRTSGDLARCLDTGRAADCLGRDGRLLAGIAGMPTLSDWLFHRCRTAATGVLSNSGLWRPGTWIVYSRRKAAVWLALPNKGYIELPLVDSKL
jgi:hypothetical protein